MKMKVLLIKPYLTINRKDCESYGLFPPMGLAYLASVLEKDGFDVRILDCQIAEAGKKNIRIGDSVRMGISDDEIVRDILDFKPDIIGISSNFTCFFSDPINIAKLSKNTYSKAKIVMGGAHATSAYRDLLNIKEIDIVVRGEGEMPFLELAQKIRDGKDYRDTSSIAAKDDAAGIIDNSIREPVMNLDELPFPAYHLLNMDRYINQRGKNFAFYYNSPVGFIMTQRGCPFNCIFCSTSKFNKKYRERTPRNVVDEIEFLVNKYRIRELHILDDCFNANAERVKEICRDIVNRNLKISWQVGQGMVINNFDDDLLRLMAESGLYRIGFSIESGSPKTLKYIRKAIDLERSLQIIERCNATGLYTHGNFVIGFPYETKDDIKETAAFILKSKLDFINLCICQPLAGADLYQSFIDAGIFDGTPKNGSHYLRTLYDTKFLKASQLNQIRAEIVKKFLFEKIFFSFSLYGFKSTIWPKLKSFKKLKYFIKVVFNISRQLVFRRNIA